MSNNDNHIHDMYITDVFPLVFESQVCLQKEQENRVKLELQVAELEEQVDQRTTDLLSARKEKEKLKTSLIQERENKQVHVRETK